MTLPKEFDAKNRLLPIMTNWQRQIVIGTLLGNSYIYKPKNSKNNYLGMITPKKRNAKWLLYKAEELKEFSRPRSFCQDKHTYRWISISHPIFQEIKDLCYVGNKKSVSMEWLNQLRDIAFSVWFMDVGGLHNSKQIYLSTYTFGEGGNKIIERYLNEVGIECSINNKSLRIIFSPMGTNAFLKIVLVHLPLWAIDNWQDINEKQDY